MIFTGILLALIIASNFLWLGSFNVNGIKKILISAGRPHDFNSIQAYVRMRIIFAIVGNTLVLGLFSGLVWWSISKRRFGIGFGAFWILIFLGNAIATPFYSIEADGWAIAIGALNLPLAIYMTIWLAQLIAYRQRLRQEMARTKR